MAKLNLHVACVASISLVFVPFRFLTVWKLGGQRKNGVGGRGEESEQTLAHKPHDF